jgi:hypothetical protein
MSPFVPGTPCRAVGWGKARLRAVLTIFIVVPLMVGTPSDAFASDVFAPLYVSFYASSDTSPSGSSNSNVFSVIDTIV